MYQFWPTYQCIIHYYHLFNTRHCRHCVASALRAVDNQFCRRLTRAPQSGILSKTWDSFSMTCFRKPIIYVYFFVTIHNIAIFVCFPITFHKGFAILPFQHKHNLRKNHATFLSSISRLKNNSDEFHLARPTATFSAHVDLHNLGNIPFLDCNFQN